MLTNYNLHNILQLWLLTMYRLKTMFLINSGGSKSRKFNQTLRKLLCSLYINTQIGTWLICSHHGHTLGQKMHTYTPPIGDPKQLDTPTAHAAANISVFLDSFYKETTIIHEK